MIDETVDEIRQMETHSSSVVALRAARALRELLDREFAGVDEFERSLERNSSALRRANPSHATLFTTQRDVVESVVGEADTVEAAKARLRDAIDSVTEAVERAKERAAATTAETLVDGETILTHDYSSTVLSAVERAAGDGRSLTAYVTEARPRYLGRKTARALADLDGVEPHLAVDGAAGHLLEECDRVVVGMDCIVEDRLYNRVGTYPIAAAAADVGVPVHVVGSSAKVIEDGFVFENELRPPSEVSLEPLDGVEIENPAYDATPTRLVDAVLTDEGRIEP
ncbi:MAG: translation initiation factor eIF-2B [Haloferacaceae archaeon]